MTQSKMLLVSCMVLLGGIGLQAMQPGTMPTEEGKLIDKKFLRVVAESGKNHKPFEDVLRQVDVPLEKARYSLQCIDRSNSASVTVALQNLKDLEKELKSLFNGDRQSDNQPFRWAARSLWVGVVDFKKKELVTE